MQTHSNDNRLFREHYLQMTNIFVTADSGQIYDDDDDDDDISFQTFVK